MTEQIVIYGAGGMAREIAWLVESSNAPTSPREVSCFIDDSPETRGEVINNIAVLSLAEARDAYPAAGFLAAIGNPFAREHVVERATAFGFSPVTLVHPSVKRSSWLEIGAGSVICAGSILTTNIRLAQHVQINMGCTVAHDVEMAEFVTLAPGVHVSGCVRINKSAYLGTGANVINGTRDEPLVIGANAVVGAGACVTRSVGPGETVVGIPARPVRQ